MNCVSSEMALLLLGTIPKTAKTPFKMSAVTTILTNIERHASKISELH